MGSGKQVRMIGAQQIMQGRSTEDGCRGTRGRSRRIGNGQRPPRLWRRVADRCRRAAVAVGCTLRAKLACTRGQGTTEYAILVGVLVVIAILAITVFRPKLEELWQAISSGIQSL